MRPKPCCSRIDDRSMETTDEIKCAGEEIRKILTRTPFDSTSFSDQLSRLRAAGVDLNATPLLRRLFVMLMQNVNTVRQRKASNESIREKAISDAHTLLDEITSKFTTGRDSAKHPGSNPAQIEQQKKRDGKNWMP